MQREEVERLLKKYPKNKTIYLFMSYYVIEKTGYKESLKYKC